MDKSGFENYIIEKIKTETDVDSCYFLLPSSNSITYFLREICYVLKNQINNNLNNNYLIELSRCFYKFLEKDVIMREIDSLSFSKLLLTIKEVSEGKQINKKSLLEYLSNLRNKNRRAFLSKIVEKIEALKPQFLEKIEELDCLVGLFINETLARGLDIRFLHHTTLWFEKGVFANLSAFFLYFVDSNHDTYDIYLPIKGFSEKNKDVFDKAEQEVFEIGGNKYLHVFDNRTIDYFTVIKSHMVRIESIFNMLKLYTNSSISFDLDSDIIVDIDSDIVSLEQERFPFSKITSYKGAKPYSKFMTQTLDNLYSLEELDKKRYHKILNIIVYSEKDNDLINPTSYVDAWISLETLYSLSEINSGISVVRQLLPMFLSTKFIMGRITYFLKCGFKNTRCKAENFVLEKQDLSQIKNDYVKFQLERLSKYLSSVKELSKLYSEVEDKIKLDILRIYMLRNEYVHESNLNAFNSLQFYNLKNYLTLSIDVFFGMLDKYVDADFFDKENLIYCVFERLIEKNEDRRVAFEITVNNRKYDNASKRLSIDEIGNELTESEAILNILLNNKTINKKFKKYKKDNTL